MDFSWFVVELTLGVVVVVVATAELVQRMRKKQSPLKSLWKYLLEIISW